MISQKKILFILVITTAVIIRHLFSVYHASITIASDTYGYYGIARLLQQDFAGYFINDSRTPFYPLFLAIIMKFKSYTDVPILTAEFSDGANLIAFVQHIIGILSLSLLFFILQELKINKKLTAIFVILLAVNPMLFSWERVLMPETLAIFFLILIAFILIKGLKSGKSAYFYLLLPLFIFLFLLKPIYVLLPIFILPIIYIHKRTKKSLLLIVSISFLYLLVPFSYIKINQIRYHYRGINRSSDINLLGKILKYDLPVEAAKDIKYFYQNVKDYRTAKRDSMPYRFLEYYDPAVYGKTEILNLLPAFNYQVISSNLPDFTFKSVAELPQALTEASELVTPYETVSPLGRFFNLLFTIYKSFQYLFFLLIILIPYSFIKFLKKPGFLNTVLVILGIISLYQIFFSVFFSYGEFGRLINPVQPIIYLFILMIFTRHDKIFEADTQH